MKGMLVMKSNKLLAKSITLGLILAMPYGVVSAATYEGGTITGWGGVNGGTLQDGESSDKITVTPQACQIVYKGATAKNTVLTGNKSGTGGRQDVYGTAIGTQVGQNAEVYVRGGKASDLVNNGGKIFIGANGILDKSTINGGYVEVQTYGKADTVTLNFGVTLHVLDGDLQNSTVNGANVEVRNGTASNNTITAGSMILKDGKITGTNINGSGALLQMESGNVSGTTVNSGTFTIQQGIAENTTLNSGTINLQKGELKETTANGGIVNVSGGTLDTIELKGSV